MNTEKLDIIIGNLRRTIQEKTVYAEYLDSDARYYPSNGLAEKTAVDTTVKFLKINIGELERILGDLEEARKEIK